MPETRSDAVVCFVQGHGAKYSSDCERDSQEAKAAQPASPVTLERVRQRAAAQLALQRVALRTLKQK
jgi:hypothetical protein